MHDAHTADAAPSAFMQEVSELMLGLQPGQAMQVKFRLALPFTAAQTAQNLARYALPYIGRVVACLSRFVPVNGIVQGFQNDLTFVPVQA